MKPSKTLPRNRHIGMRLFALCCVALCMAGCDPTIFKKPTQELTTELRTLRDGYFALLKLRRDAQFERIVSQQRQAYWVAPQLAADSSYVGKDTAQLDTARKRELLPRDHLLVRQRAFDVLDSYAGTLLALASNESTESIAAELTGLTGDLKELATVAKDINVLKGAGEAVESWLPTLSGALGAVQQIIQIVSNVMRTNAIRDVVHAGHDPIKKLLLVLATESSTARNDALQSYEFAIRGVESALTKKIPGASDVRTASEYLVALRTARDALRDAPTLSAAFDEANTLQDKLYKSVTQPDVKALIQQAQRFRHQVRAAKAALDAVP